MLRIGGVCGKQNFTKSDREKKASGKCLEKYFWKFQQKGTELYVDGEKVSPSKAAEYAVREESPYMADYVIDDRGEVSRIRLEKVDLQ